MLGVARREWGRLEYTVLLGLLFGCRVRPGDARCLTKTWKDVASNNKNIKFATGSQQRDERHNGGIINHQKGENETGGTISHQKGYNETGGTINHQKGYNETGGTINHQKG
jgi:hypothetical protein